MLILQGGQTKGGGSAPLPLLLPVMFSGTVKKVGLGGELQPPHFSLQMKITPLLLGHRVNKSCKVTETAFPSF